MGDFTYSKYSMVNDKKPNTSYDFWQPGTSKDYSSGGAIVPSGGWTYDEFITNTYEVIRAQNPNYITRTSLGLDQSGTYAIYKYIMGPEFGYEKTIILNAGAHGNEYTGSYGLFAFLERVANATNLEPFLNYLRNYVRIIVSPVLNPWGFENARRQNVRGVDLNRNSSYNHASFGAGELYLTSTPTSATTLTLTDTTQSWTTNQYANKNMVILSGTGAGQSAYIASNTSNTLTFTASRELDTAPDGTSTYQIMDKYYKGTEAWSEAEGTIYKNLIDAYPEATLSLDFHTISTLDAQYIVYTPRFMNTFNNEIWNIVQNKYINGERVVWNASALPTLTNYCANEYGMFAGNPEFCNLKFGSTKRDATEMERCLWWFGNLIMAGVSKRGRGSDLSHSQLTVKHLMFDTFSTKLHSLSRQSSSTDVRGVAFAPDGSYFFAMDDNDNNVYKYSMTEDWNIDTASYSGEYYNVTAQTGTFAQDVYIASDTRFYVLSSSVTDVFEYDMTGGDITTATPTGNSLDLFSEFGAGGSPIGMTFNSDGTKLYICGLSNTIAQYNLDTGFDFSDVITYTSTLDITAVEDTPRAIDVNGAYLYVLGETNETIYVYDLDTTTLANSTLDTGNELDVSYHISTVPRVVRVDSSGQRIYTLGTTRNMLYQFYSSTPNNLTLWDNKEPEYLYLESDESQKTIWSTVKEFDINTTTMINVRGNVTLKADEDCTVEIRPLIYQPYNPEFGWSDVKDDRVNYFIKRVELEANKDKVVDINSWIHGAPVNVGMNDGVYGTKRVFPVKLRMRMNSIHNDTVRVYVREFRVTLELIPTEIGFALELYDASDNLRTGSTDYDTNGESSQIKYPNPDFFNVDNYKDGDGDDDIDDVDDPDTGD